MNDKQETETLILAAIDALNEVASPLGAKFIYHEENMGLAIAQQEGVHPDWQEVVNRVVTMTATMYSVVFEISAYTTKDKPLSHRHQELHRVFMSMGDLLGSCYELASQDAAADIEIAKDVPVKH